MKSKIKHYMTIMLILSMISVLIPVSGLSSAYAMTEPDDEAENLDLGRGIFDLSAGGADLTGDSLTAVQTSLDRLYSKGIVSKMEEPTIRYDLDMDGNYDIHFFYNSQDSAKLETLSSSDLTGIRRFSIPADDVEGIITDPESPYYSALTFVFTPVDLSFAAAGTITTKSYTGKEICPAPKVTFNGETLVKGVDYTLSYKNNKNIGNATVIITGIDGVTGSLSKSFAIKGNFTKDASKLTITVKDQTYTGSALLPTVTVKAVGTSGKVVTLKKGTDYSLAFKNNKNIGTASVSVIGKGKYFGTKKTEFYIVPKGTRLTGLYARSGGFKAVWKKQASNTTGYQLRYSKNSNMTSAVIKTITSNEVLTKTYTGLTANRTYYVQIRTYMTVNGTKYCSAWSEAKEIKTKA